VVDDDDDDMDEQEDEDDDDDDDDDDMDEENEVSRDGSHSGGRWRMGVYVREVYSRILSSPTISTRREENALQQHNNNSNNNKTLARAIKCLCMRSGVCMYLSHTRSLALSPIARRLKAHCRTFFWVSSHFFSCSSFDMVVGWGLHGDEGGREEEE